MNKCGSRAEKYFRDCYLEQSDEQKVKLPMFQTL